MKINILFSLVNLFFFFFFSFKLPGQLLDRSWKSFLPKTSGNKDGMVGTLHSQGTAAEIPGPLTMPAKVNFILPVGMLGLRQTLAKQGQ